VIHPFETGVAAGIGTVEPASDGHGRRDLELAERESGPGGRFPLRGVAKATSSKHTAPQFLSL